jgi:hypothetical protein
MQWQYLALMAEDSPGRADEKQMNVTVGDLGRSADDDLCTAADQKREPPLRAQNEFLLTNLQPLILDARIWD